MRKRGGLSGQHFEGLEPKLTDHSLPPGMLEAAFIDYLWPSQCHPGGMP